MPEAEEPPLLTLRNSTLRAYKLTPLHVTSASSSSRSNKPSSLTTTKTKTSELPLSNPAQLKHHSTRFTTFLSDISIVAESNSWERIHIQNTSIDGISIYLKTTKATYTAFLLRRTTTNDGTTGSSVHYPLLLTRMTAEILRCFHEYLSDHFDCHVSPLRISPLPSEINGFMESCLCSYISSIDVVSRDVQLVFEPPNIPHNHSSDDDEEIDIEEQKTQKLKTLTALSLTISKDDVLRFHRLGKQQQSSSASPDLAWKQPFMSSFSHHMYSTTGVRLSMMNMNKVSCGDFVLAVANDSSIRCKFFVGGVGEIERGGEGEDDDEVGAGGREDEDGERWTGLLDKLLDLAYKA